MPSAVVPRLRSWPSVSRPPYTVPWVKSTFSDFSPRARNRASPRTLLITVRPNMKLRIRMKSNFGRANSFIIFNCDTHRLCVQKSNIRRVTYSEVNRLMIRPRVSETLNPFRLSLPNVYRTMEVKMLVRWVSMMVGNARSYPLRMAPTRVAPFSRSSRIRS